MQESPALLLTDIIDDAPSDSEVRVIVESHATDVRLQLDRAIERRGVNLQLVLRVIVAQGGHVIASKEGTTITFPAAKAMPGASSGADLRFVPA